MLPILKFLPRILKNTFLYNYYRWVNKFDCPVSILPKLKYIQKIDIQTILDNQTMYILRRSDKSYSDTFNDVDNLRDDALLLKDIPFLSLNILGGLFKPEHTRFRIIKNGMKRWEQSYPILITEFLTDYEILDKYCIIFIEANGINNQSVPYSQKESKDLKKEIDKFFTYFDKPIIVQGQYKFEGTTKLIHDPINLNYWHLELNLFDFKNDPIKFKDSAYIKDFCKKVITDIICANSYPQLGSIPTISEKYFINN